MGRRIDNLIGTRQARTAHRAAKANLNGRFNNADTDPDSPEYLAAHDATVAAEKKLPRWRRNG